jgi:DMSO/TMAO reductase YedYZ heme-binding membrane subunit
MLAAFTAFHVVLSLAGILAGFVVTAGLISGRPVPRWTLVFLATTIATSVTGFFFPVEHFMPSHAVGILSLLVLAIAVLARYRYALAGGWQRTYAITAVIAFYFNFFVLVVQLFAKAPALHALAPTQQEPPFAIAQGIVLVAFIVLGVLAARSGNAMRPSSLTTARSDA